MFDVMITLVVLFIIIVSGSISRCWPW